MTKELKTSISLRNINRRRMDAFYQLSLSSTFCHNLLTADLVFLIFFNSFDIVKLFAKTCDLLVVVAS